MDSLSRALFIPIILVLDAWVFQYLVTVYYPRRREMRVCMLLVASFLCFSTQLYFHEDRDMMMAMNDISETSIQLTFIIQITIIGRAVSVKVKLRSIVWFTYVAEVLIVLGWISTIGSILEATGLHTRDEFHAAQNVLETISLVFVLIFRFFYLSLSTGLIRLLMRRKFELLLYMLLVIHEFPFMFLEELTGVSWEFAQGVAHRLLVVSCIILNVHHKARTTSNNYTVRSKKEGSTTPVEAPRPFLKVLTAKKNLARPLPLVAKIAVASTHLTDHSGVSTRLEKD
ncbi:hypothetical protein PHYBOEH_003889 [Phytophthora boehmeriae]|uniref:Uncharacterized protein n=1 Tax=Phytophthora boehmeriae TaxID=109152 RepID=A0A8T1WUB8_9STRA|nr:hypothetical protein PHYBOEH_003889 [Phytophthora boehmeriae]